jgi:hypothetical protein
MTVVQFASLSLELEDLLPLSVPTYAAVIGMLLALIVARTQRQK